MARKRLVELIKEARFGSIAHELWKLGTPTTDREYQKCYEASELTERGKVLQEYSKDFPGLFSKSSWVRAALAAAGDAGKQQKPLTDRELKIWAVIQRGVKGPQYCRELDSAGIAPLRSGIWKDCPRKYESAYREGARWRHRIQDEKSKIQHKAKLAELAKLASE